MIETQEQRASTADEYRELARKARVQREANQPSYFVPMPSGAVWEMRRPDIQGYVLTGVYPQSLVNEAVESFKKLGTMPDGNDEKLRAELNAKLNPSETINLAIFARELTVRALVSPKIGYGPDEVLPMDIDPEDFKYAMSWCMNHQGVAGIDGLRSFREGPERGTTVSSPTSKKRRRPSVKRAKDRG